MNINPLFVVEITETSPEDVLMKVWKSVNGQKSNDQVFDAYYIKRAVGVSAEEVCRVAAPHLFL